MLLLMWWAGWKRDGTGVALVFVRYAYESATIISHTPQILRSTNDPESARYVLPVAPGPDIFRLESVPIAIPALILATNTGSVPVELWAAIFPGSASIPGFAVPTGKHLPRLLEPGESVILEVTVDPSQGPWWTEFAYQRRGLRDRPLVWAWDSGNPTVQKWVAPAIADLVKVKCGPITNQPPTSSTNAIPFQRFLVPLPSKLPSLEDLRF